MPRNLEARGGREVMNAPRLLDVLCLHEVCVVGACDYAERSVSPRVARENSNGL